MGQRETSVVRQRRLRAELRRIREESGRTQKTVAEDLGWSTSKVIRLERGTVNVSTSDVMAMLYYYGIEHSEVADDLLAVTRTRVEGWWQEYREVTHQQFRNFLGYEDSATRIRQYMRVVVPGLLQTEEYARVMFGEYFEQDQQQVDLWTLIRMRRQELLDLSRCPDLLFVLDEAVIHRWVGGPEVMREQLTRLKELARHPRISIRIVPFSKGMYRGMQGSNFTIFEFPSQDSVVTLEDPHRDVILDDPETSNHYVERFLAVARIACLEWEVDKIVDTVIDRMRLGVMI
jgi:transcriptional regulator with XRE-family HTH domain